jgi:hypothetical protein
MTIEWATLAVLTTALFTVIGLLATALFQLRGQFDGLATNVVDLRIEIAGLRADMKREIGGVRVQLEQLRAELQVHFQAHAQAPP